MIAHITEKTSETIGNSSEENDEGTLLLESETRDLTNGQLLETLQTSGTTPTTPFVNDITDPQPSTSRGRCECEEEISPLTRNLLPKNADGAKLVDAPTFVFTKARV